MLVDTLLALARDRNPVRYKEHEPYHLSDPFQTLQEQMSDLTKRLTMLTSLAILTKGQQYQIAYHWIKLGRKDSLQGFDLSEIYLQAAKLSGADLRQANPSKTKLGFTDLDQAELHVANLNQADFSNTDLKGVNLNGANLRDVI